MQDSIEGKSEGGDRIRVMVRVRPLNTKELDGNDARVVQVGQDNQTLRMDLEATESGSSRGLKTFKFDHVFDESSTQPMIFSEAYHLMERALEGYNCTIFTYGQTGSGKTHTMLGHDIWSLAMETQQSTSKKNGNAPNLPFSNIGKSSDLRGILPRTLQWLFDRKLAEEESDISIQTRITVSYLEIYNEKLFDLLEVPSEEVKAGKLRSGAGLDIRIESTSKRDAGSVYVPNLTEIEVFDEKEVFEVLWKGAVNRSMAATDMNEHSSRSHTVFTVKLERKSDSGTKLSKICLVDLAGSEKWRAHHKHTEARIKELVSINQSLSNLGNCIVALTTPGRTHVPYRNSRLTRLLQDSLGGNTKTIFIVTLSPASTSADVSASTLQFADRAMRVQVYANVNESLFRGTSELSVESQATIERQKEVIGKYEREVARLKELLRVALKNEGPISIDSISGKLDEGLAKEVEDLRAENVRLMEDLAGLRDKYEELKQEKQMIVDVIMRSSHDEDEEEEDNACKTEDGESTGESTNDENGRAHKNDARVRANLIKESLLERRREELEVEEQAQDVRMKWLDNYRDWLRTLPVVPQDGQQSLEVSDRLNLMETSLVVQSEELVKAKRAFLKSRNRDQDRLQNANVEIQERQGASSQQSDTIHSQQSQIDALKEMIRQQSSEIQKIARLAETSTASAVAAANSILQKQSLLEEEVRRQSGTRTQLPLDPLRTVPVSRIPKLASETKAFPEDKLSPSSYESRSAPNSVKERHKATHDRQSEISSISSVEKHPRLSSASVKKPPEPKLPPPESSGKIMPKPAEPSLPPKKLTTPAAKPANASNELDSSSLPRQAVLDQVSRMLDFAGSVAETPIAMPEVRTTQSRNQPRSTPTTGPLDVPPQLSLDIGPRKFTPPHILTPSEAYLSQLNQEENAQDSKNLPLSNKPVVSNEGSSRQADIDRLRAKIRKSTSEVTSQLDSVALDKPKLSTQALGVPELPDDLIKAKQTQITKNETQQNDTVYSETSKKSTKKKKPKKLWAEYMDVSTQMMYYHNRQNGKTQWERPSDEEMSAMAPADE